MPYPYPGARRLVYPGFLQLSGFMAMNFDRHVNAHIDMFNHLMEGDGDSAEKHREFYDEYLAVMDLTAEFYLQTIETVFVRHLLPEGKMTHDNQYIDLTAINRTALMTVEGEKDDISGLGQTKAAQDLCTNIPPKLKLALRAGRRRPLRRVQRLALPQIHRPAHPRVPRGGRAGLSSCNQGKLAARRSSLYVALQNKTILTRRERVRCRHCEPLSSVATRLGSG